MGFEVGRDQVHQQQLVNLLLIVDAVRCHDPLEVRLEHPSHLNCKLLDAQCSVLCCCLLALFFCLIASFVGSCSSAMTYLFRWPVSPAMSVVGAGDLVADAPHAATKSPKFLNPWCASMRASPSGVECGAKISVMAICDWKISALSL
ncbi:hypothetical protein [Pseudomonas sp. B33.4]|uniref:hypothetical protein n=1 Tax=Pseudomonas sp. B33.4 TaxID=3104265 RepID=UPI003A101C39